jgi:hypothetical protein
MVGGYLTSFVETDPAWSGRATAYYTAAQADAAFATGTPVYVESDPRFRASVAAGITGVETGRWETAYGWGDHGAAGYLTSFTEVDPLWSAASNAYYTAAQVDAVFATGMPVYVESDPAFSASVAAGITSTETTRWETAYGWGDHGAAGYLTSVAEVDPLWSAASNATTPQRRRIPVLRRARPCMWRVTPRLARRLHQPLPAPKPGAGKQPMGGAITVPQVI